MKSSTNVFFWFDINARLSQQLKIIHAYLQESLIVYYLAVHKKEMHDH